MRRGTVLGLLALSMVVIGLPAEAGAARQKVGVCHHRHGTDTWKLIEVGSLGAAGAHLAHGDGAPSGAVPGIDGFEFGADCSLVEVAPRDGDLDGVIDEDDNCPTIPNPDQVDNYGSGAGDVCEDTDGDGTVDPLEPHICVSVNGAALLLRGAAECAAAMPWIDVNVAIAHGEGATAHVDSGAGNSALSMGDGASARVLDGSGNAVTAVGVGSVAMASSGDNNVVEALGSATFAVASGTHSVSRAAGSGAWATNFSGGTDNVVVVDGDAAWADVSSGNYNTARALAADARALAGGGDFNTAVATVVGAVAEAVGNNNTATNCSATGGDNITCSA